MLDRPIDPRIIHVFQEHIDHDCSQAIACWIPDFDCEDWQKILVFFNANGLLPRRGKASFPFKLDSAYYNGTMPAYNPRFSLSFEDITDLRFAELCKHHADRPWIVSWSGGIDSTTVLCAIIKNASKEILSNLKIGMTAASIFENQEFFDQVIKDRFDLIDLSTKEFLPMIDSHYVITGEPNDLLMGGINLLNAGLHGLDLSAPWRDNHDLLVYLEARLGASAAAWICRLMEKNLSGLTVDDPPVTTVNDWFWWINFCCKWAATANAIQGMATLKFKNYLTNCVIHWYDSHLYQHWSMVQGRYHFVQHGYNLKNYKLDAKKYIRSVVYLPYFDYFKTKMASLRANPLQNRWFGLQHDFSPLLVSDLPKIRQMLPGYLNIVEA